MGSRVRRICLEWKGVLGSKVRHQFRRKLRPVPGGPYAQWSEKAPLATISDSYPFLTLEGWMLLVQGSILAEEDEFLTTECSTPGWASLAGLSPQVEWKHGRPSRMFYNNPFFRMINEARIEAVRSYVRTHFDCDSLGISWGRPLCLSNFSLDDTAPLTPKMNQIIFSSITAVYHAWMKFGINRVYRSKKPWLIKAFNSLWPTFSVPMTHTKAYIKLYCGVL